ncbi:flippase [Methanobacterium formicicum]|uniref:O-antigen transporter n=1 Tax=Methanobacterium formicicum (strain DSM 3637 / PP1) TaxID=1204725 RepID=K2R1I5_METFP|nr:flippase [Methanobacterium formicicum]EKF86368.1 O-antigen transporter [Methanobacterium formicicum DSM 3637]
MIKYLKKILNNENYKRIIENIVSLFSLQGLTYILPLITFPYLTRVLGPDKYGQIAFAAAFITYFQTFTDYGFNLSATREVSLNRDNDDKISEIFSSIFIVKIILMTISLIIMTIIVFSFDIFRSNWILYYFTFGILIGRDLLLTNWLFQGMEKMRYITILNIGTSIIYTLSIFVFVKESSDYLYVPLINSFGSLIIGLVSLRLINKEFNVKFIRPTLDDIIHQFKEGFHLYISTLGSSLYLTSTRFILGLFVSDAVLGYYTVAETLTSAFKGLISPISQAIYPYISRLQSENPIKAKKDLKKILIVMGTLTFILSIVVALCAPILIKLLAGENYAQSIPILQILIFTVFAVGINNVLGIQGLVAFGYKEKFSKIIVFAGIFNVIILVGLIILLGSIGAAIAVVTTEFLICIIEYIILRRVKIL